MIFPKVEKKGKERMNALLQLYGSGNVGKKG